MPVLRQTHCNRDKKMAITKLTIDEIKRLNVPEKIVEEIWDSIFKHNEYLQLTKVQRTELNQRIDSYHAAPQKGRAWDEISRSFWDSKLC